MVVSRVKLTRTITEITKRKTKENEKQINETNERVTTPEVTLKKKDAMTRKKTIVSRSLARSLSLSVCKAQKMV